LKPAGKFSDKFKHAFAVKQDFEVTEKDLQILDKAVEFIVKRNLEAPAIFALQSLIPLSFIGSQTLVVMQPFLDPFTGVENFNQIVKILEHRDGVELFIQRIEQGSKKVNEK
jgi:hypothetical protein